MDAIVILLLFGPTLAVGGWAIGYGSGRASGIAEGTSKERYRNEIILSSQRRYIDALEKTVRATTRRAASPDLQSAKSTWRTVLGIGQGERVTRDTINKAYHRLAKTRHPDSGGSTAAMAALNVARDAGLREVAA